MLSVALGADHAGWELKEALKSWLLEGEYQVLDFGTHSPDSVDYPDYAQQVGESVAVGKVDRGVLVCGTGIGMAMAALCVDTFTARMSREHNDANVLALAGRLTAAAMGRAILKVWLETDFAGGRHGRRVDKITEMDARRRARETGR